MKKLREVVIQISISPEDVDQFDNLGFEVNQRHVEIASEIMEERFNDNFFNDLFNALLAARHYYEEEKS